MAAIGGSDEGIGALSELAEKRWRRGSSAKDEEDNEEEAYISSRFLGLDHVVDGGRDAVGAEQGGGGRGDERQGQVLAQGKKGGKKTRRRGIDLI